MILGDETLISVVVLSQTGNCYFMVLPVFYVSILTTRAPLTTECVAEAYNMRGCPCSRLDNVGNRWR
jgi:hypothetical protein